MKAELIPTLVITFLVTVLIVIMRTGWELHQMSQLLRLRPNSPEFWWHWAVVLMGRPAWWGQFVLTTVPAFFLAWALASLRGDHGQVLPGSLKQGDLES